MNVYYNEFEPYAAEWIRNLIAAGLLPRGEVDTRSIVDVRPADLAGFTQCHFFAGIGGWSLAARLAGWPDDRPLWTGSCPCQPFSVAGRGLGERDERHLWPVWFELIRECRPPVVMGEQVAAAVGKGWIDGVFADLEGEGYACGAAVVPACAVDAPHRRDRLWFVADRTDGRVVRDLSEASSRGTIWGLGPEGDVADAAFELPHGGGHVGHGWRGEPTDGRGDVADTHAEGRPQQGRAVGEVGRRAVDGGEGDVGDAFFAGLEGHARHGDHGDEPRWVDADPARPAATAGGSVWAGAGWIIGADGKARRFEPGIRLLAHGYPTAWGNCAPTATRSSRKSPPK